MGLRWMNTCHQRVDTHFRIELMRIKHFKWVSLVNIPLEFNFLIWDNYLWHLSVMSQCSGRPISVYVHACISWTDDTAGCRRLWFCCPWWECRLNIWQWLVSMCSYGITCWRVDSALQMRCFQTGFKLDSNWIHICVYMMKALLWLRGILLGMPSLRFDKA